MAELVQVPDEALLGHLVHGFSDNHDWFVTAHRWTSTASNSGTVTQRSAAGGGILLTSSDATPADNDEVYVEGTNETFLLAATKPLYGKSVIQYTEAATDDANVFAGFIDATAADTLRDDGLGMKTTSSHVVVYKVDGETVWRFGTSVGTAQTSTTSTTTAGGSVPQRIEIYVMPHTATTLQAWAVVDGAILKDSNGLDIIHTITLGSPTEMAYAYGVKAGSDTTQTAVVYHTSAYQKR